MTPPITAVLFDLGDTLWHFPKMPPVDVIRAETVGRLTRLLEGWGFQVTDQRRFLGRDIRLAVEEATTQAFHGDCVDPGYSEICRRLAARHGLDLTPAQGEELWEAWNLGGVFLRRTLFPDTLDTLRWLQDRGYRLGSVTNRGYGGPRFRQEVRDLGLAELFEVIAVSCDVGYMKPHPRIFQYALDGMAIEPEETVMVGDSLRADVEGAKTMGMIAIWRRPPVGEPVEDTADQPESQGALAPDYTIDELAALMGLPLFADRAPGK
jgi:HAD superfamily hydrolase (TIGR01549 family)